MTDNGQKPAVQRAVELAVFAPIGFVQFAKDVVPPLVDQFVTRGRSRVEELQQKVENQLGQARILGQFAVSQGTEQVRRQVGDTLTEARRRGEQAAGRVAGVRREGDDGAEPTPKTAAAPAEAGGAGGNGSKSAADASGLPIPDYDELSASQVVARLSGLSGDDLEAVRAYETSQRRRKTILTKIEQLTG